MGGLKPRVYLSKNAGVMPTCNLWTEVGLCNGEVRTVLDVIKSPTLPVVIIIQFDEKDYSRPSFCTDILNCVPLYPVTNCSDALRLKLERRQYPHKAQGLTLNDVWIELGPSERAARLTYTLTRFCEIFNLVIEPVTFEGLKSLKKP